MQSKWVDAEPVLSESEAIVSKSLPQEWWRFSTMSLLGAALSGRGRHAEAEPLIIHGYEGLKAREAKIPPAQRPAVAEAAGRVVRLYDAWAKPARAAEWKARLGLSNLPADVFVQP